MSYQEAHLETRRPAFQTAVQAEEISAREEVSMVPPDFQLNAGPQVSMPVAQRQSVLQPAYVLPEQPGTAPILQRRGLPPPMQFQVASEQTPEPPTQQESPPESQSEAPTQQEGASQEQAQGPEGPESGAVSAEAPSQEQGPEGESQAGAESQEMATGEEQAQEETPSAEGPVATGSGPLPPASPEEDPNFQAIKARSQTVSEQEKSHEPASQSAGNAQSAANSPSSEVRSKAQANQINDMQAAETPGFDAAAFKGQLMERIAASAPGSLQEADNFKNSNNLNAVKGQMKSKVSEEKKKSTGPMETATKQEPNTAAVPNRQPTPLSPEQTGPLPGPLGAEQATPPPRSQQQVEKPLRDNSRSLDTQMSEAGITEEQLANSNEPQFNSALQSKKEAQQHAATQPGVTRQFEQGQLNEAQAEAGQEAQNQLSGMHAERGNLLGQVLQDQQTTISNDEAERARVAAEIQGIYNKSKTSVEQTLSEMDAKVQSTFDAGANQAQRAFEDYVGRQMDAYKDRRYSGLIGKGRWLKDKLLGMPSEVNAFYQQGRELYLQRMDQVINQVVEIIGAGLAKAKEEVAKGRQEVADYVAQLPENLHSIGQEAAANIQGKFDMLEQSIDNKQEELINTLAQKYNERLSAVDARIEEMKAANQGLVDKAINAVKGVIDTILRLKDMLLNVLSRAAGVIGTIIKDPIGFLGNLVNGVKAGLSKFIGNIGQHMKSGLINWLTGSMGGMGISLPDNMFSLKGIFGLVMQVMGLGWDYVRKKAVKLFGEKVVSAMEKGFEIFRIIATEGIGGLWGFIKDKIGNLKEMVMDQIKDMLITQVIQAGIKWIIGLLNPASAFIKAAMAIYDIVKFFITRGQQMLSLVSAVIDSISAIAGGNIATMAGKIEQALAKGIPVAIGFLASLLGVSGLTDKVKGIIGKIRGVVDKGIDWVLDKARGVAGKFMRMLGFGKDTESGKAPEKSSAEKSKDEKKHAQIGAKVKQELNTEPKNVSSYDELYLLKSQQAKRLEKKYNPQLEPPVKLSITLPPKEQDKKDDDIDISIKIAPNDWTDTIQIDSNKAEPHADIIAKLKISATEKRAELGGTASFEEEGQSSGNIPLKGNVAVASIEVPGTNDSYSETIAKVSGYEEDEEIPAAAGGEMDPAVDEMLTRRNLKARRQEIKEARQGNRAALPDIQAEAIKTNETDAERKLYLVLLNKLKALAKSRGIDPSQLKGKLYIYTERHPCTGCIANTEDFASLFPNIDVKIFYEFAYN